MNNPALSLVLAALVAFPSLASAPDAPASAPRFDSWKILGPGGGGAMFNPTVSPHDPNTVIVTCDMSGGYLSRDGGRSWRNFNLRGTLSFVLFDPVDPRTIYATNQALWRSADSGRSWNLVFPAPQSVKGTLPMDDHAWERLLTADGRDRSITALAVDPSDSRSLFAAIEENRRSSLYQSTDWGATWRLLAGLPWRSRALYIDPRSPKDNRVVYAAGPNAVAVWRDGGWRQGSAPAGVSEFHDVSAGFTAQGTLLVYAVAAPRRNDKPGLYVSSDGGRSWRRRTIGWSLSAPEFPSVACSWRRPEVAYLSFSNLRRITGAFFGVARTGDAGLNWDLVRSEARAAAPNMKDAWLSLAFGPGYPSNPIMLGVAPTDPNICYTTDYGRTMRSTDGGHTWYATYSRKVPGAGYTSTGLDVTTCYGVHFDPHDSRRVFISYTDIGLFRSEDGGVTWDTSIRGVPPDWWNTTYWIEFDPQVKGRVWGAMSNIHDLPRPKMWRPRGTAHYDGGVCISDDGGRSWRVASSALPPTAATHILLEPSSPASARTLYVASFTRGVFKSTDSGKSWQLKNRGIDGATPFAWRLTHDRNGALYLVVARATEDGSFDNAGDGALYRSEDGAESWRRLPLPRGLNGPNGVAVDPEDPNRVYLAAWRRAIPEPDGQGGIWLSTDHGRTWRRVLSEDQYVYDVTIDPRDPRILYASGFSSSAWRSADRGLTWQRIRGFNFKWGHRVIPDPHNPGKIYVTTFGGSVWHGPAEGDPRAPEDIATPVLAFSK